MGDSEQVLIENQVPIIPSHAVAFDAINTLILYAVGNNVDVTIEKVDLQTYFDTIGTRKKLSMIQSKITDY